MLGVLRLCRTVFDGLGSPDVRAVSSRNGRMPGRGMRARRYQSSGIACLGWERYLRHVETVENCFVQRPFIAHGTGQYRKSDSAIELVVELRYKRRFIRTDVVAHRLCNLDHFSLQCGSRKRD